MDFQVLLGGAEQLFGKQNNVASIYSYRLTIILAILFFVLMFCISYLGM